MHPGRRRRLRDTLALDPAREHVRIARRIACWDFPFDLVRALEFALFRTYGVPSTSRLLARTREFLDRTQKRYDDTDLIVSTLVEEGYDSPAGRRAITRMNALHGRFAIDNVDFLYVLSTFVFVPIRWLDRFGWRRLGANERVAWFLFWRETGRRMGIRDLPDSLEDFARFHDAHEAARFVYDDANRAIATATRELFVGWAPPPLRPLVRQAILALVDPPLRRAVGFPAAPRLVERAVHGALRLRARVLRALPPRRTPNRRTRRRTATYGRRWELEGLGPATADPGGPAGGPGG